MSFKISLAEWSLHRAIRGNMMTNMDFPRIAKRQFGIEGLEFVNQLWGAPTSRYISQLKKRIEDEGTTAVLIMVDGEGNTGSPVAADRKKTVENHQKWLDAAAELGCTAIRTNMYAPKNPTTPSEVDEFLKNCSESFAMMCDAAKNTGNLNVTIENHGGASSNPEIVVRLMKMVQKPNLGTLPDFGNFPKGMDKYQAVGKLMPYAKAVSYKCYDFDANDNETNIDVPKMMKVVTDAGYSSWVGIEYEGRKMTEFEGIQAAKRSLLKLL
jgi:sugar phosphate isomerase/epimerase